jgi:DNA-binding transcriptional ArsR family regulator
MKRGIIRPSEIDRIIHEPARLAIVALLDSVEEADFQYLQQAAELTKGNLSVHLTKLEEAGYVAIEKTYRGKYPLTICRLTELGREKLEEYRKLFRSIL